MVQAGADGVRRRGSGRITGDGDRCRSQRCRLGVERHQLLASARTTTATMTETRRRLSRTTLVPPVPAAHTEGGPEHRRLPWPCRARSRSGNPRRRRSRDGGRGGGSARVARRRVWRRAPTRSRRRAPPSRPMAPTPSAAAATTFARPRPSHRPAPRRSPRHRDRARRNRPTVDGRDRRTLPRRRPAPTRSRTGSRCACRARRRRHPHRSASVLRACRDRVRRHR